MIGASKIIRGSVKLIRCINCGSGLPLFEFDTETDTGAIGLCSAAQCNGRTIIIAETTLEEWNGLQSGNFISLRSRLISTSGIPDLQILHVKRIERKSRPSAGISFSEFKKLYQPPVVIYDCPCCADGEAFEVDEVAIAKFKEDGGVIKVLDNSFEVEACS